MSDAQYQEGGGDTLPPYQEDFFQRIVNVSWAGKLAVDLQPGTYLDRGPPVDMTKVVISLWFRISQTTMNSAWNTWNGNVNDDSHTDWVLSGIVPLLVWGETASWSFQNLDVGTTTSGKEGPSFIGVYVGGGTDSPPDSSNPANLVIRLQSQNSSTLQNYTGTGGGAGSVVLIRQEGNFYAIGYQDSIHLYGGTGSQPAGPNTIDIAPDVWHHLLLSYSVPGANGTMHLALDDEDKNSNYLYPAATINMTGWPGISGVGGPNDITATYDWPIYNIPLGVESSLEQAISGGFSMVSGPAAAVPIRSSLLQYANQPIEFAELQIFTGVTLDTSNVGNRRVFIGPSTSGKTKGGGLVPVDPKQAQKFFGKKPDVLLHTIPNWQKGKNTGSLGDYSVSGKVKSFEPEPQLGK